MPSMKTISCRCCGKKKQVRTADVARGWGLFCSKSCKATHAVKNGPTRKKSKRKYPRHDGVSPMKFKFCFCGSKAINGLYTTTGISWYCDRHMAEYSAHPFSSEALGQD